MPSQKGHDKKDHGVVLTIKSMSGMVPQDSCRVRKEGRKSSFFGFDFFLSSSLSQDIAMGI